MPLPRREPDKDDWVIFAADFLVDHLTPTGRVEILDTQYPESHMYLAGDLFPLLEAYALSNDHKYLDAARRILDYFRHNQDASGSWTLGFYHRGGEITTTLAGYGSFTELADKVVAAAPGWPLAGMRKYERLTGDEQYRPMARRAIDYLLGCWNEQWGFDDGFFRPLFKDVLNVLGLSLWQDVYPDVEPLLDRAMQFVTSSPRCWSASDKNWYVDVGGPDLAEVAGTLTAACALLETTGTRFVDSHVQPALERILASNQGRCAHNPAVLSYWPYREDRADVRSNVYMLLTMKLMDVITGVTNYRQTQRYRDVAAWLGTMRDEHGFLEYENCHDGTRGSHASPAQFLICYWVCGTYKWD